MRFNFDRVLSVRITCKLQREFLNPNSPIFEVFEAVRVGSVFIFSARVTFD